MDGLGNLGRVEALPLSGKYYTQPCLELDSDFTDAIQAPQGLLGPVGSQRSRQAVDAYLSALHLSGGAADQQEAQKRECSEGSPAIHFRTIAFHGSLLLIICSL